MSLRKGKRKFFPNEKRKTTQLLLSLLAKIEYRKNTSEKMKMVPFIRAVKRNTTEGIGIEM